MVYLILTEGVSKLRTKKSIYFLRLGLIACLLWLAFFSFSVTVSADGNVTNKNTLVLRGDANGDGWVTMSDVSKVERILLGLDVVTPGADANGDGLIDMGDVIKIERIILGLDH
jgi:hypothetical protein